MLDPKEFAILPWGGTSGDRQVFETIRECGFNLAGFVAPKDVHLASEAGLQCIVMDSAVNIPDSGTSVSDATITSKVEGVVKAVGASSPAVFGYYLRDEPAISAFPALAQWSQAFRKADPNAWPYINLFPSYLGEATLHSWGAKNYEDYVEQFVRTVKPSFVSYDNYSLMDDGTLRDGYFQNLEVVRTVALRNKIPFWNIVLGNSHFHYAEPSIGGLRFQAYTTLAYGARGISYFTYFAPPLGNYRLAAIDQFGNKTPTWDMLRQVNLQIRKLAPVYTRLTSVNVFHHPEVPSGSQGIATSRFVAEVSGETNLLVGEFEGPKGQPYVMLVNKDLHKSTPVGLKFKAKGKIKEISAYSGSPVAWEGEHRWLAAGQGVLLTVE